MGGDYVPILVLLCFLFRPCYPTLLESIDMDGNLQKNEKNTTVLSPKRFQFPWRADFTDEGSNIISHYAMWHTMPGQFYGLRAEMSIWASPNIENSQESGASIQIYCQDRGHYNLIQAGFHISPSLYHNRDIRFFTYWTKDSRSKGCYNLQCGGFIPASGAKLVPGQAIAPPSIYGIQDHYIRLSLNKDPNSGGWVVYRHDLETPSFLGHFPKELCPETPRIQALTGFVNYLKNARGPPMGSGHFPDYNEKKSAYFNHIKKYNSKGQAFDPRYTGMVKLVDRKDCYDANDLFLEFKKGYTFNYGGPGGCIG
ncbi:unnamed protein product [Triticum aestivum]|uniref:Neprosin PEP catalytic domain-containing protein n=2 Tax=Triticum aestivum TaxID=4565 RepID=A0A9R1EZX8_WHEAT|nr:hypothetical protein CFC21_032953 [Triticum aestivum]SPT21040.1 unnamed protein product [Triticum aestivum]